MFVATDVADAVGRTPLIKLRRASDKTGCTILGKAEFMNPGQSVKDRAALYIIREAERAGNLRPGGTIVEGTAGNTGIGLTIIGAALVTARSSSFPKRRHRKRRMRSACSALALSKCRQSRTATRTIT